jgi:hypothetical protein
MQDSVVGGDIHTGNVVHNHYPTASVPPQPMIMGQPQAAQPQVGMGMAEMGMPATSATTALVLSILSIFCGGICLAIPGLIIANQALAITDQYPGHPDAGSAKTAKIISWIVIGLTMVVILLYVVMGVALVGSGEF